MKPNLLIATLTLAMTAAWADAAAATDRSYYVTELTAQQKFDVYNDGRNTYLESIPGLVVTGATADGERYIVNGVPQQIRGFMNGKPITVVRGTPPIPKPAMPDPAVVNAQIKQLSAKLEALTAKVPVKPATTQASVVSSSTLAVGVPGMAYGEPEANGMAATTARQLPTTSRAPSVADVHTYRVSPNDENLRVLVERWSKMVGWKSIWDVDRDILISTSGEKAGDWRTAIRWILSSSKFGDLAVKPCFYNNSVVRVVRETVKCNPNE